MDKRHFDKVSWCNFAKASSYSTLIYRMITRLYDSLFVAPESQLESLPVFVPPPARGPLHKYSPSDAGASVKTCM